jgi:hypothetical protein
MTKRISELASQMFLRTATVHTRPTTGNGFSARILPGALMGNANNCGPNGTDRGHLELHIILWKPTADSHMGPTNQASGFVLVFFVILGFELRAYTLSHSTSPFL